MSAGTNFILRDIANELEKIRIILERAYPPVTGCWTVPDNFTVLKQADTPQTDCDTCKWGEWYRNGRDITNMDDECGGCCSWNSKWTPKETKTEAERLDRIDNEIEDAWARIRELTADTTERR